MTTHSSILAWKIQWTEEPGGLQSTGSQRIRHDQAHTEHTYTHTHKLKFSYIMQANQNMKCSMNNLSFKDT